MRRNNNFDINNINYNYNEIIYTNIIAFIIIITFVFSFLMYVAMQKDSS